jgi:hypothetical protein
MGKGGQAVTDKQFDHLCEANSFGAVARNEFPLVPRAMLKALVDAAVSTEILKQQDRIKRLEEAGDALKASGYFGGWADAVNKWIKVKEDKP